ncbi:hypothetical protein NLX67_14975 [Domibacillus sp. A3M-37]|uniref:hypothetical protein n=1 Tax=Domibacillus sp. A3M-37 TaxID=2962037 RepID=UPI0020B87BF2|nr:hypothetical protein [Domibacillus sp. A3M-37]MCP3763677.1 hypothetical protein [Domibacillus sp. A3M-37]
MAKAKMPSLTLVEGATLEKGERIEVYFNIRKGGFSIKSIDKQNPLNGKVIAHTDTLMIEQATFQYSQKTLEKIHAKQQKAVYAVVRGYYVATGDMSEETSSFMPGYCNPYTTDHFINWQTKEEIKEADLVYFYDKYFNYKQ